MRTLLHATHHGSKDQLSFFLAKDPAFWFLFSFGKICTPISLNGVLTLSLREITFYFSKNTRKWHPPQRCPRRRIFQSHPSRPFLPKYWQGLNHQPSPWQGDAHATPDDNADFFFCTFLSRSVIFHHDIGQNRSQAPIVKNRVVPKHPTHQQRVGALLPIWMSILAVNR